ncbi:MAG: zf-HC2 domain-containing protein [Eubacterium sp.]|nr:zf-HC2 domain-containing protein [Eubacterium sp.]
MNHLEAQSYIMPFIEGKLPDSKRLEFVMHMKNCRSCHDELEIYYTLMTGMQILADEEEPSGNFRKDLEAKLKKTEHKARSMRSIRVSMFTVITIAIALFMILFYGKCLTSVYAYEQDTKQASQGEYYFYNRWKDILLPIEDRYLISTQLEEETAKKVEKPVIFDKIKSVLLLKDYEAFILELGGRISDEKTSVD